MVYLNYKLTKREQFLEKQEDINRSFASSISTSFSRVDRFNSITSLTSNDIYEDQPDNDSCCDEFLIDSD